MKEFTLLNYSNKVYYKIITTINHSSGISNDEKIVILIFLKQLFQQHLDAHWGSSMMDVYAVDHLVLGWTRAAPTQTCSSVLISAFVTDLLANLQCLHCQMYFCMSYWQTQTDIYNKYTFGNFFNIINQTSKTLGFGIGVWISSAWNNVIWRLILSEMKWFDNLIILYSRFYRCFFYYFIFAICCIYTFLICPNNHGLNTDWNTVFCYKSSWVCGFCNATVCFTRVPLIRVFRYLTRN